MIKVFLPGKFLEYHRVSAILVTQKNWLANDPAIDGNRAFAQHLQTVANRWIGDFKETVYEVNMLVIDEKNVVAMKDYPPLTKWLDQRGITVHFFDLRTRSFWDGGWHCLTLDIHRDDDKKDLYPGRGDNGVYWRLK
jgi:N-dimethylarginine dimethylaminohydrolase